MNPSLLHVTEQFPHLRERVISLFEHDPIFREMCDDYGSCVLALCRQECDEGLRHEYAALRLRLETEMLAYLHDAEQPRAGK